jgi:hypothetical protein
MGDFQSFSVEHKNRGNNKPIRNGYEYGRSSGYEKHLSGKLGKFCCFDR